MKKISLLSCVLFSGTVLVLESGCARTVNTIENAQPVAYTRFLADKRIITDSSLNKAVCVLDINQSTSPGGFLKIQLQVQNTTSSLKKFTYRIVWFDADAMVINLPTAASLPVAIEGKEIIPLTAVSPTPLARDFRITFIAAH